MSLCSRYIHTYYSSVKDGFYILAVVHIRGYYVTFATTLPEPAPPSEPSAVELTEPPPAPVVESGKHSVRPVNGASDVHIPHLRVYFVLTG